MPWNRLGMLSLVSIVVALLSMAMFQSTSSACLWDEECVHGQFCETTLYKCVQCLRCEELKREPPSSSSACIRSITDCGPCIKGLVEDRSADLNCVLPIGDSASSGDNTTMWIIVGIFLVLLMIAAAVLLTHLWRTRSNKFTTSGQNDTVLPVIGYPAPTAPESPPPYRPNPSMDIYLPPEEAGLPLIKTDLPNSPLRYLETEDPRKANVFNPPAYVRYGDQADPPSGVNGDNDNQGESKHDENTRESMWTPGPSNSNASSSEAAAGTSQSPAPTEGAELSAALAAARNTDLVQPPAKRLKQRDQNENNMENGDEDPHENGHESSSRSAQQFNIVIQVNQKLL